MLEITELNRLLSLPAKASDICGFRLDLGDGREVIVQKWTPSVTNDDQVVKVSIEGVIEFKDAIAPNAGHVPNVHGLASRGE